MTISPLFMLAVVVVVEHGGADRAAVYSVDWRLRRMDLFVIDHRLSVHDGLAENALSEVEVALKGLRWWRSDTPNLRVCIADWSQGRSYSQRINTDELEKWRVELLDMTAVGMQLQTKDAAEEKITDLLEKPKAMRAAQHALQDSPLLYECCIVSLHQTLEQHSHILQCEDQFSGSFLLRVHKGAEQTRLRFNPSADKVFATASSNGRDPSIYRMIASATSTKSGKKCLEKWIKRPSVSRDIITARHDTVEGFIGLLSRNTAGSAARQLLDVYARLFRHFQAFESQLKAFTTISLKTSSSQNVARPSLSSFAALSRWIRDTVEILECSQGSSRVQPEDALNFATLMQHVGQVLPFCDLIDQTTAQSTGGLTESNGTNDNDATVDCAALLRLRSEISECKTEITDAVNQVARALHLPVGKVRTVFDEGDQVGFPGVGFAMRVSRKDSHRLHQHHGRLVTILRASKATGVWFTVPTVEALGARWNTLRQQFDAAEEELSQILATELDHSYRKAMGDVVQTLSELDVLMAFALVSRQHRFVRAHLSNVDWRMEIIAPFNPVTLGNSLTLDVDIALNATHRLLLLEDDSTVEETASLLHLVGIIAVLNQIGCFVPCARAGLPVFDAILLRTGAYDQQLFGNSTFMTEMQELKLILENMTPTSLVLIDDLCRGTSSRDGLALAAAICSHLLEWKACVCLSSAWRELISRLILLDGVTTPIRQSNGDTTFLQRRLERDEQFSRLLDIYEMPPELVELVRRELS